MQNIEYKSNFIDNKKSRIYTKRHYEIIDALEKLLEQGVPDLTMSEIAKKLKISLRTLYEIAPSRDKLILMTMDNILRKLGKHAFDSVCEIRSPIERLERYLFIVNQAVGPKFDRFLDRFLSRFWLTFGGQDGPKTLLKFERLPPERLLRGL